MTRRRFKPKVQDKAQAHEPRLYGAGVGLRQASEHWLFARDGNPDALAMYRRHYSQRVYHDGRRPKLFVGPGEKLVLLTGAGDALFVWRRFKDASGQRGVNCAIFRNEGPVLSSALIREAVAIACRRWVGERLYTYVDPVAVHGDGACFKHAGWRRCGRTKDRHLVVLEFIP